MSGTDRGRPVEHAARIVLRPIGNPLPLGFLALAGGTRRSYGAASVGGNLDEQLERIEREAGVREQL